MKDIFITGGTGYIGSRLIKALQKEEGYRIRALARKESIHKLPAGCEVVAGDALNSDSFCKQIRKDSIFIHLIGVAHPSPAKKEQFKQIDLVSVKEAARAATMAGAAHFIYVSVSQYPSSIMKDYQQVRAEGENILTRSGIPCSFIRPWYVLGPGHWWPIVLVPFYELFSLFPGYKEKTTEQGLVTIHQMIETLLFAIRNPAPGTIAVYTVPDIKNVSVQKRKLVAVSR